MRKAALIGSILQIVLTIVLVILGLRIILNGDGHVSSWTLAALVGLFASVSIAGAFNLLSWSVSDPPEGNEAGEKEYTQWQVGRNSLIAAASCFVLSLSAFFAVRFAYPIPQGKEAVGAVLNATFIAGWVSFLVSLISLTFVILFAHILPKGKKRHVVRPVVSLLLFKAGIEVPFAMLLSLGALFSGILIPILADLLVFLPVGFLLYSEGCRFIKDDGTSFDDPKNPLGGLIRNARIEKGLTQKQLAKLVGADKSAIALMETGSLIPERRVLLRLSEILDIDIPSEDWAEAEIQENGAKADSN